MILNWTEIHSAQTNPNFFSHKGIQFNQYMSGIT